MRVLFLFHPEMFFLLPAINLGEMACECCDEPAGTGVEIGWLAFGVLFLFAGKMEGHE